MGPDAGITVTVDQWVTDVPQSMSGSETTINRLFRRRGSAMDQYWDLGMREYLDRLAAEHDCGDAAAAVRGHNDEVTGVDPVSWTPFHLRRRCCDAEESPALRAYRLTGAGLSPAGSRQLRLTHRNQVLR